MTTEEEKNGKGKVLWIVKKELERVVSFKQRQ